MFMSAAEYRESLVKASGLRAAFERVTGPIDLPGAASVIATRH